MKLISVYSKYLIAVILVFSCLFCEKTEEKIEEKIPVENLLKNGSFEINGKGTIESWKTELDNNDIPTGFIADKTPLHGGDYSIGIRTWYDHNGTLSKSGNGYAETSTSGLSGEKIFEVSAWVLGAKLSTLKLVQKRDGIEVYAKEFTASASSGWRKFQFQDTLILEESDSLIVGLKKYQGHFAIEDTAFFDMIRLIVVE